VKGGNNGGAGIHPPLEREDSRISIRRHDEFQQKREEDV